MEKKTFDKSVFLESFRQEAEDHFTKLSNGFLQLEKEKENRAVLDEVFRVAHTLKGSSRMMGFNDISDVAHVMEDLLDKVRSKTLTLTENMVDAFLEALEGLEQLLDSKMKNVESSVDVEAVKTKLRGCAAHEARAEEEATGEAAPADVEELSVTATGFRPVDTETEEIRVKIVKLDQLMNLTGELIVHKSQLDQNIKRLGGLRSRMEKLNNMLFKLKEEGEILAEASASDILREMNETLAEAAALGGQMREESMDMREDLAESNRRMGILIRQVQQGVMKVRMLPLSTIFAIVPTYVRKMAKEAEKKVKVVMTGEATELDKRIIDEIKDPLMHLIRNCIDHGIESEYDRGKSNKPKEGAIFLSAYSQGSQVVIEVGDDGRGIQPQKVKQKAVDLKLITSQQVEDWTESDLLNLIFLPGFSTVESVSTTSGRGVGMDVVKERVEKLKGMIEIKNVVGKGVTFFIKLPLTLSISDALLVRCGGQGFALPLPSIERVLTVKKEDIQRIETKEAVLVGGQLVPMVRLMDVMRIKLKEAPFRPFVQEKPQPVIVVGLAERRLGLLVDDILAKQEIVIKSIEDAVGDVENVAGVTILGNGEIALILDIPSILNTARGISRITVHEVKEQAVEEEKIIQVLAVEDSLTARELIRSILESAQYKVEVAVDGVDALQKLSLYKFDLILTDVQMPRMDGIELVQKIRKSEEYKDTPVVILSTMGSDADKRRGIEAGATAYLVKSGFQQQELLDLVERLVK